MNNWRWLTYIYFMLIAYGTTYMVKEAERKRVVRGRKKKRYTRYGRMLYIAAWLILTLFVSFRNPHLYPHGDYIVSTDVWSYIHFFETGLKPELRLSRILSFRSIEPVFFMISSFIRMFTDNYHVMWFVIYGIMSACYLFYLSKTCGPDTDYTIWVMWFSVYLHYTVGIRSGLALGFGLVAAVNYREKKYGLYLIWAVLTVLSHYSAVIMVGGMVICSILKKLAQYSEYLLFMVAFAAFFLWNAGFRILSEYMGNTKFHMYTHGVQLSLKGQLVVLLCAGLSLFFYCEIKRRYPAKLYYVHLAVLNMILVPFIIRYGGYRINDYFLLFRIPVWETCKELVNRKCIFGRVRLVDKLAALVAFLWLTKCIYDMHANGLMPIYTDWL